MTLIHTFAGNPLDRADAERRDEDWLARAAAEPNSRYLPFWQLNVLLDSQPGLGWLPSAEIERLDIDVPPVFLGCKDGIAHFAIDISELGDPHHELNLDGNWQFDDCRSAAMHLDTPSTGIVAQSRAQLDWHRRHRFCSVCGERTEQARGGHVRRCGACRAEHFPRTDPVAIMLVVDGERCLLGQSAGRLARTGMYSALAGFIDQGESIEEAVRREVREEAGVTVGAVRYHSSQPWPFPSSLMIGCHGRALTTDIRIDPNEMADVAWFEREAVRRALAGDNPQLRVPGPIAIAHHLIRAWADGEVEP
ncbi:MAG: NAD(+) diphosphatase [Pseudomonadales bacterium]